MDFLHTSVVSVPSCSKVMMMLKKGTAPSGPVSSTVNLIALSMEFIYSQNLSLYSVPCMTKVSSIYLFQSLGNSLLF